MAPLINPGDVVVSVPVPVDSIEKGDVITFHVPIEDHWVETHRVTAVERTPAGVAVRTKGDANQAEDPWQATLDGDTVFRQVAVIPHLGAGIRALREPIVGTVLLYGAPALLSVALLSAIWTRSDEEEPADA
ncbi:signal peptidase I [Arthrobacter sp. MDT1-65]